VNHENQPTGSVIKNKAICAVLIVNCAITCTSHARQTFTKMYDNWTAPLDNGVTVLDQTLRVGGDEIGDDINLRRFTPGIIDSFAWTVANLSSTQTMENVSIRFRFYNRDSGSMISTLTTGFGDPPLNVGPLSSNTYRIAPGSLSFFNLAAAERMYMTMQVVDIVGIPLSDFGVLYGGPITTGTSSSLIRNFTTGQDIDLGPGKNLGFLVSVTIPTPASASLLLITATLATRRRRP
jgi:hypothetical protein